MKFQNGTSSSNEYGSVRKISYTGNRTFCINILEDREVCNILKDKIEKIVKKNEKWIILGKVFQRFFLEMKGKLY